MRQATRGGGRECRRWALLFGLLLVSAAPEALAVAPPRQPRLSFGPVEMSEVVLEEEALQLECREAGPGTDACRFTLTGRLRNPQDVAQQLLLELCARPEGASPAELQVDGAAVPELAREAECHSFEVQVAAGAGRELKAQGELSLVRRRHFGFATPAVLARHPWLSGYLGEGETRIAYQRGRWGGAGSLAVEASVPAGWRLQLGLDGAPERPAEASTQARARFEPPDGGLAPPVYVTVEPPTPRLYRGGPQLGVGARMGSGAQLRLRLGYELAGPSNFLYALQAESDLDEELVLAPVVQVATPSVFLIPSLGMGLGVPVSFRDGPRVGLRLQPSAFFYAVGLVYSADFYFSGERRFEHSLLVTVSL